MGKFHLLI